MSNFTKDIETPDIGDNEQTNVKIGTIVSGIPTVFARANIFKLSLDYIKEDKKEEGLLKFYKSIVDEWRGLIACIALSYEDISVSRIFLKYSDGKDIKDTANIYEPKGAFGNMLFERKQLWCEQGQANNVDNAGVPFVDVIKYRGKVVGATSPESLLFTSVSYSLNDTESFINKTSKSFTDPVKNASLNASEIASLYGFVEHIMNGISKLEAYYSNLGEKAKPSYESIKTNLKSWLQEIKDYTKGKGYTFNKNVPPVDTFISPFNFIFNFSTELYGSEGMISETIEGLENPELFNPRDLLLDDKCKIARFNFGNDARKDRSLIDKQPIYVLTANVKNQNIFEYFALPITALGLNVFGQNLGVVVGNNQSNAIKTRIHAIYDPEENSLEVDLKLVTNQDIEKPLKKKYQVSEEIRGKDILLWPNFISKQWGRYFMYSEIPHNCEAQNCPYRAYPFVGNTEDDFFRILTDENNSPIYLAKNGKIIADLNQNKFKAQLHVVSDNRVSDNNYKYEIYESSLPFKGVKLMQANKNAGYIIIRYQHEKNLLLDKKNLIAARLGIDFGSTNTSVAYFSMQYQDTAKGFQFKNRRLSLLSNDDKNNDIYTAVENEIFFFQNDEIESNGIKSQLTIHNRKRLVENTDLETSLLKQAVKGGFPCFEKNLPINQVKENRVELLYPNSGTAEIVHNMKWSSSDIENSYKTAYLNSLLLHIYAQLFEENHYPERLKWSYPSSMGLNLIRQYETIWDGLQEINPLTDKVLYKLKVLRPNYTVNFNSNNDFWSQNQQGNSPAGFTQPANDWGNNTFNNVPANNMWNTAQPANTGFNTSQQFSGWGQNQNQYQPVNIKTETETVKFNFTKLTDEECLTEASAVANFINNQNSINQAPGNITLCFDVGGSTTDISALCQMNSNEGPGLAMIKQNSIRFAAQRVAMATKYSPNFKQVILELCEKKGYKIQGINDGVSKYSPETAPYYFEQIVDRLNTNEDFELFYHLLHGKCPELMCVNLYVTGLIMYYAGQLSYKLIQELQKSDEYIKIEGNRTFITVVFAGKGARIFDWLRRNNKPEEDYFTQQFISGFGGNDGKGGWSIAQQFLGNYPTINPTNTINSNNVKYEVSKGLAFPADIKKLLVPQNKEAIEILGEEGFIVLKLGERVNLPFDCSITNEMMEHTGTYFMSSPQNGQSPCPRFEQFSRLFFYHAKQQYNFQMTQDELNNGCINMNINSYITTLPEYRNAKATKKEGEKFDFVAPIIILEGMKFYDDFLLNAIAR